eukprot:CAMPEP_0172514472 /NCGR_PEP_ID=MMETSP1066-20121228/260294_1 /TAXON_ID=671091 /ORGANISM="Coscinodiscus wailesii, Strain CCMP2513" /LENGTH=784 /DNA_ID=CAMNT_0013295153 /DNA_START=60 /DNA_END=2414 /DNA_ORIENTATION=+
MTSNPSGYTLSQTLPAADASAVRSVTYLNSSSPSLLLGSESGTVTCYDLDPNNTASPSHQPSLHAVSHPHPVTALVALPSNGYATGSKDSLVRVYNAGHELVTTLKGHENAVTDLALDTSSGNYLLSGSWDGTCKVWDLKTGKLFATLPDHENTVCVLPLSSSSKEMLRVLTGSVGTNVGHSVSGYKLRVWEIDATGTARLVKVIEDHGAPIRSLTGTAHWIASGSNDGAVIVRGLGVEKVQTLRACDVGVPPLILKVSSAGERYCLASTEDGQLVIWDTGSGEKSVIRHPGCLWCVLGLENGDIVTGCDDGKVRVFTLESSRFACKEEREELEKESQALARRREGGPSSEEIAKLDKWEMRASVLGKGEGTVRMFNKNGRAIAAQWSEASGTWIEVGEVMGRQGNAGSINGVEYDHVLPIEIDMPDGGLRKMQIGYNNGENPFVVAQKFIDENMLNQAYLAEIADYIRKRVGDTGVELGGSGAASSTPQPMDVDNFSASQVSQPNYKHIPMKGYMSFETGADMKSLNKIMNKFKEFYEALCDDACHVTPLESLKTTLAATSRYHSTAIEKNELDLLTRVLSTWSSDKIFPVLDLLRLTVIHPDAARLDRKDYWTDVVQTVLRHLQSLQDKNSVAVPMLSFRLFANSFRGGPGSVAAMLLNLASVLTTMDAYINHPNKNVRLAVATTTLNASAYLHTVPDLSSEQQSSCNHVFTNAITILNTGSYEAEAMTRVLVALGTMLLNAQVKALARETDVGNMIMAFSGRFGEKADHVLTEIGIVLAAV